MALDCMSATAAYARKVMRFALDHETPVMERIATRHSPSKNAWRPCSG